MVLTQTNLYILKTLRGKIDFYIFTLLFMISFFIFTQGSEFPSIFSCHPKEQSISYSVSWSAGNKYSVFVYRNATLF